MISNQISETNNKLEALSNQINDFNTKNKHYKSEIDRYQSQKKNSINKEEFNKICQEFDNKLNTQNSLLNSYKVQLSQTPYSSIADGYKITHIGSTDISEIKSTAPIPENPNASIQLTQIRKAAISQSRIIYMMVLS